MSSRRVERVQDLIMKEISRLLLFKAKDPLLGTVTVTGVRMTADLRQAHVYYSIYQDDADQEEIQRHLDKAAGFFRREVGRAAGLKYTPEIQFTFDRSLKYAQHMDRVLRSLSRADGIEDDGEPQ